ncbi:IclR family transcriptional regulator [Tsuneonella sp. HG094]
MNRPIETDKVGNGPQRKSIQSVEIGARVLEALVNSGKNGAPLREVADKAGLSRSQAHRYLLAFVNSSVVEQDPGTGLYALGSFAVRLGMAALARVEPVQVAGRHLLRLLTELKTTGLLTVWGNYGPTVVRWIDGGIPLFTTLHTGSVLPLQISSSGLLFLTYCPREQVQTQLDNERAAGVIIPDAELERLSAEARQSGYARTYGTVVPGLSAVTVPIFDADNRMIATMGVLARTQDQGFYSQDKIERIKRQALETSRAIGWSQG